MGHLFPRVFNWVLKKADVPDVMPDFWSLSRAWEASQCNDRALYDSDRYGAEAEEARSLAKRDPVAGFAWMLRLAQRGSVWAMLYVAYDYHYGVGVGLTRPSLKIGIDGRMKRDREEPNSITAWR